MNLPLKLSLVAVIFVFLFSCSKSGTSPSPTTNTNNTGSVTPTVKAGTVDKTDTLNIMAYNVLNYGDLCQGSTTALNNYLKIIIQSTNPDLFSLEKMNAYPPAPGAAGNLADDISNNALNIVYPGRYAYATATNMSGAGTMSTLFYNKQKLTYVSQRTIESYVTDFNLYKLYYNDPNLNITKDTTYLYVLVNHTQSGDASATRDIQLTTEMQAIRARFSYLPNMITMGDFNFRNSSEAGYQAMVSAADTSVKFYDTPFFPDKALTYPANWDTNPAPYSGYLTTSTRLSASLPNICGTSGGAKSWYDHIFLSPWLINATNYIQYVKGSYKTIGNDGQRLNASVNTNNTAIPQTVAEALFQFSNKYPVSLKLVVKANRTGSSAPDPVEKN